MRNRFSSRKPAFTLAELLVGMALLGLLSALAVPGLLNQSAKRQSMAAVVEDTALDITAAYAQYRQVEPVLSSQSTTKFSDFLSYLSALATDTTTNASSVPSGESALTSCATNPCLQLNNGALLQYSATNTFGGNTPTNYITLSVDPDGAGDTAGRVSLLLYQNGRVVTGSNAYGSTGSGALSIATDPAWMTVLGG